eukprot:scaffold307196_cov17-Tisochrysis_lutea.AAC.1
MQGMLPEELADLAGQMEAALSRVRAQQAQASAEQELLCPCCWERRKDLVCARLTSSIFVLLHAYRYKLPPSKEVAISLDRGMT